MERRPFDKLIWIVSFVYLHPGLSAKEIIKAYDEAPLHVGGEKLSYTTFNRLKRDIPFVIDGIDLLYRKATDGYYIEERERFMKDSLCMHVIKLMATKMSISELLPFKERVLFDSQLQGVSNLAHISHAIAESWQITFLYKKFLGNFTKLKRLEPYGLYHHEGRWYLVGRDVDIDKVCVFGCDRMHEINITNNSFQYPRDFNVKGYFNNYFGVYWPDNKTPEIVRIKVQERALGYFRTKPLHHSQREVVVKDGFVFEYYIVPTSDFRHALIRHEENIEVLEPEWFRQEIADHLLLTLKQYQETTL